MEGIKDGATKRISRSRREAGTLWQPRFFDRALCPVEEYNAKVEYIHWNPVKAGLVSRPEERPWSSVHDYTGSVQRPVATPSRLAVDRALFAVRHLRAASNIINLLYSGNAFGQIVHSWEYSLDLYTAWLRSPTKF
jgi:hypothetical protein